MEPIVAVALSYLSGSIPFAAIAGKLRGVDLRKHGSGNLGATNVFRVLGWKIGVLVFLADALKGGLPVHLLPPRVASPHDPIIWAIACGIAAIVGHVRPIFLKLHRGGKGVATRAGEGDAGQLERPVRVLEKTICNVSSSYGAPVSSRVPPQMSTTFLPST